jgi:hypothetical protein
MNGVKSPKIEAAKVVRTRRIHGNDIRNTVKIAITRGANENVWSWIDVSVWIRLTTIPTTMAAARIGPTIHKRVERAFCISDVTRASFMIFYITLRTRELTIRYQPSTITKSSIFSGIETMTGGSCIIPIESSTLETARSITKKGRKRTNPI